MVTKNRGIRLFLTALSVSLSFAVNAVAAPSPSPTATATPATIPTPMPSLSIPPERALRELPDTSKIAAVPGLRKIGFNIVKDSQKFAVSVDAVSNDGRTSTKAVEFSFDFNGNGFTVNPPMLRRLNFDPAKIKADLIGSLDVGIAGLASTDATRKTLEKAKFILSRIGARAAVEAAPVIFTAASDLDDSAIEQLANLQSPSCVQLPTNGQPLPVNSLVCPKLDGFAPLWDSSVMTELSTNFLSFTAAQLGSSPFAFVANQGSWTIVMFRNRFRTENTTVDVDSNSIQYIALEMQEPEEENKLGDLIYDVNYIRGSGINPNYKSCYLNVDTGSSAFAALPEDLKNEVTRKQRSCFTALAQASKFSRFLTVQCEKSPLPARCLSAYRLPEWQGRFNKTFQTMGHVTKALAYDMVTTDNPATPEVEELEICRDLNCREDGDGSSCTDYDYSCPSGAPRSSKYASVGIANRRLTGYTYSGDIPHISENAIDQVNNITRRPPADGIADIYIVEKQQTPWSTGSGEYWVHSNPPPEDLKVPPFLKYTFQTAAPYFLKTITELNAQGQATAWRNYTNYRTCYRDGKNEPCFKSWFRDGLFMMPFNFLTGAGPGDLQDFYEEIKIDGQRFWKISSFSTWGKLSNGSAGGVYSVEGRPYQVDFRQYEYRDQNGTIVPISPYLKDVWLYVYRTPAKTQESYKPLCHFSSREYINREFVIRGSSSLQKGRLDIYDANGNIETSLETDIGDPRYYSSCFEGLKVTY